VAQGRSLKEQVDEDIEVFHVLPGLFCNLSCGHCGSSSSPKEKYRLTQEELKAIASALKIFSPKKLLFTGGEPTFHIDEINEIISNHPDLEKCSVQITTNGWFAKQEARISKVLNRFVKLDSVQLSYDQFHKSKLESENIYHLSEYCSKNNIKFNISVSVSDPSELVLVSQLKQETKVPVIFNKIEACGRAKETEVQFRYPIFESRVLGEKCPNINTLNYICGRGFTICCSNLIFNQHKGNFANLSLNEYLSSEFHQEMKTKTFQQMLDERGISKATLRPEHSSACQLCEYAHTQSCGKAEVLNG
jgi:organic radical activating enzyme